MRVNQANHYINQNAGIGANSKRLSEKDAFQISSRSAVSESQTLGKSNEKSGVSPQSQFASQLVSATKRILELQVDPITNKVGNEWVIENADEYSAAGKAISEVQQEKVALIEGLLDRMGVKGKVTGGGTETVPNIYTTYYVETEGDGKNLFILELENGELMFAETDRLMSGSRDNSQSWAQDLAQLSKELYGYSNEKGKLSSDELKNLYAKFLGVGKLKGFSEFISDYAESHEFVKPFNLEELKDLVLELSASKAEEE